MQPTAKERLAQQDGELDGSAAATNGDSGSRGTSSSTTHRKTKKKSVQK